jgi:hypothetical protein
MTKLSRSPERNTFQREGFLRRQAEHGLTPENDKETHDMLDYYNSWDEIEQERESDPKWKKDNLEYDLRSTEWILEKTRESRVYAQNLYAALCNNDFIKREMWPILKEQKWHCSWRYAGGILAHMQQKGDYIDWYCSGIRNGPEDFNQEEFDKLTEDQQIAYKECLAFVSEGVVTDEIEQDLYKLGWLVSESN